MIVQNRAGARFYPNPGRKVFRRKGGVLIAVDGAPSPRHEVLALSDVHYRLIQAERARRLRHG